MGISQLLNANIRPVRLRWARCCTYIIHALRSLQSEGVPVPALHVDWKYPLNTPAQSFFRLSPQTNFIYVHLINAVANFLHEIQMFPLISILLLQRYYIFPPSTQTTMFCLWENAILPQFNQYTAIRSALWNMDICITEQQWRETLTSPAARAHDASPLLSTFC